MGEVVLSTERLTALAIAGDRVRVGAGVPLQVLQEALAAHQRWFPPVPTYLGAFVGGAVATCAAGAATFRYGTVRGWVEGLTVVLAGGDVLEIVRGQVIASAEGAFEIETPQARDDPSAGDPHARGAETSAGYYCAPGMDLIDLFIGSEGTLGRRHRGHARRSAGRSGQCLAFVPFRRGAALAFVRELREQARLAWEGAAKREVSICRPSSTWIAVSARSCARTAWTARSASAGPTRRPLRCSLRSSCRRHAAEDAFAGTSASRVSADAPDTPIVRFCRALDASRVLDAVEIAVPVPSTRRSAAQLREAVPAAVNQRVGRARPRSMGASRRPPPT